MRLIYSKQNAKLDILVKEIREEVGKKMNLDPTMYALDLVQIGDTGEAQLFDNEHVGSCYCFKNLERVYVRKVVRVGGNEKETTYELKRCN